MKKILSLLAIFSLSVSVVSAQSKQQFVFDISGKDSGEYGAVLTQCQDILKESPNSEMEIVCHENAVYMLLKNNSSFETKMSQLQSSGKISFIACENSMQRFNVSKTELVSFAKTVPVAVLEISQKKASGWSYKRAGNEGEAVWGKADRTEFVSSCVNEAKKGITEERARAYCECMLIKMEKKYPNAADAAKLTDADIQTSEFQALIKDCLK
jgi:intracellular sulfur oxidation DsrE/DsrF family protein